MEAVRGRPEEGGDCVSYCDKQLQTAWERLTDKFHETSPDDWTMAPVLEFWDKLPDDDPLKGPLRQLLGSNAAAVTMLKEHKLGPWEEEQN